MTTSVAPSSADELAAKLSSFRSLDTSQIAFLRSLFLSFSTRPQDQSHIHDFLRKQYRDIPAAARSQLGQGIAELFRAEDRADEEERRRLEEAVQGDEENLEEVMTANKKKTQQQKANQQPKLTWKSFHRVCAALGLHLTEKRGQIAIKKFGTIETPVNNSAAGASSPLANAIEPGMSFDDFMIFYSSLSKPLSLVQEYREVWKLLDEDLDGLVPISLLRQMMIGLEYIQPSNTTANSTYFYETNYKYHFTPQEKQMSKEELIDSLLQAHFLPAGKNLQTDKINFAEFVEFLYA